MDEVKIRKEELEYGFLRGVKEMVSAVGLYMRLKGWDKVKEEREELVGEEMRELLKKDKEKG